MPALNYNSGARLWPLTAEDDDDLIRDAWHNHIGNKMFPCVAARAALGLNHLNTFIATHPGCPADDAEILAFLYGFVDRCRDTLDKFSSAAVIFRDNAPMTETVFDALMWRRLQALADLDRTQYRHDPRVSADPASPNFSFSLKEEAFYIIGLHSNSCRPARQFAWPVFVFNPHAQFEELRRDGKYESLKSVIRKRDVLLSGSINPMLRDFGEQSEVIQYSGKEHGRNWQCPLNINEQKDGDYTPA